MNERIEKRIKNLNDRIFLIKQKITSTINPSEISKLERQIGKIVKERNKLINKENVNGQNKSEQCEEGQSSEILDEF